jgi:hypothetical protein
MTFTLDLRMNVLRRFRLSLGETGNGTYEKDVELETDDLAKSAPPTRIETLIVYDSAQMNTDESVVRAGLEGQPW